MREEELRTELANWKKMYKEAQEQYNEKTAKLAELARKTVKAFQEMMEEGMI